MINDPTITASCDKCDQESEPMELCPLAGGGWDERYIESALKENGWKIKGNLTYCDNCSEEEAA